MAQVDIAEAVITLNAESFVKGLQTADKQFQTSKTGWQQVESVGKSFESTGKKLTLGLTTPIVALGTKAVQTGAEFESAMSKVQALSGATGDDLGRLEAKARELGAATVFSAKEAAEGLQYMALAGYSTEAMLESIEPVLLLAAGAELDLGRTSDIVTDAMTAMGLEASETARFTDVLARTMTSSNTDVSQLGEAFKYVAPLAGSLGFSIEDLGLVLGTMADNGIKGSQAGTVLRGTLTNLVNPTDAMAQAMEELGIEITREDGSMKSLKEIMDVLRSSMANLTEEEQEARLASILMADGTDIAAAAMEGLTEEEIYFQSAMAAGEGIIAEWSDEMRDVAVETALAQSEIEGFTEEQALQNIALQQGTLYLDGLTEAEQAQAAATIFGKQALAGTLAVINTSEEAWEGLAEEINNAEGATQELYNVQQDNLNGSLAELNSAVEEVFIAFAEFLIPVVRQVVEWLTELATKIGKLDDDQKQLIIRIAAVAAAIGPVILAVGKVITTVTKVIAIIQKVVAVIKIVVAALNPWVLAIAAVVAALVLLYNKCEWFRDKVDAIWAAIKKAFIDSWDDLIDFFTVRLPKIFEDFVDFVKGIGENIKQAGSDIAEMWNTQMQKIGDAITAMIEWFKDLPGNIMDAIGRLIDDVVVWAQNVYDTFTKWIGDTVDAVIKFFVELPGNIINAISTIFMKIEEWGLKLLETFTEWVTRTIDTVIEFFSELPYLVGYAIGFVIGTVIAWGKDLYETFIEWVDNTIKAVVYLFTELPGKIWNAIVDTFNKVADWGSRTWQTFEDWVWKIREDVTTWFSELPGRIWNAIVDTFNKVADWGSRVWNDFKEWSTNIIDIVWTTMKALPGRMWDAIVGAFNTVAEWGSGVWTEFKEWAIDIVKTFYNYVSALPGELWNAIVGAFKEIQKWGNRLYNEGVAAAVQLYNAVVETAMEIPGQMYNIGINIVNGVWNGIVAAKDRFVDNVSNFFGGIVDGAKRGLGISSPAKKMFPVGEESVNGAIVGLEKREDALINKAASLGDDIIDAMSGTVDVKYRDSGSTKILDTMSRAIETTLSSINVGLNTTDNSGVSLSTAQANNPNSTVVTIENIYVRNDEDLRVLSNGLYNTNQTTLRALGMI